MRMTVVICTWNRSHLLQNALEQMTQLIVPDKVEWELLVVNNNCTDATDEVIASYRGRLPIRRVWEPHPGLSNARNRAIQEATGNYILWTDDDVLVDKEWMKSYSRALDNWPEASIFGGPIEPWFEGTPPTWLQETWSAVANAYAVLNFGKDAIPLSQQITPYGANYAVRAREQARFPYDPQLGRRGLEAGVGEETMVLRAMLQGGATGWWVPEAQVRHYVPRSRQTVRYLRRYFFGYGQYCAVKRTDGLEPRLFGRPRWLWRQALQSEARYRFGRLFSKPHVWIEDLKISSQVWGQLRGAPPERSSSTSRQHIPEP